MKRLIYIAALVITSNLYGSSDPLRIIKATMDPILSCLDDGPAKTTIVFTMAGGSGEYVVQSSGSVDIDGNVIAITDIQATDINVVISDKDDPTQSTDFQANLSDDGSAFLVIFMDMNVACTGGGIVSYSAGIDVAVFGAAKLKVPGEEFPRCNTEDPGSFENLPAGKNYVLTFLPESAPAGCQSSVVITFDLPNDKALTITSIETTAETSPEGGTITVSVEGGNPPYVYCIDVDGDGFVCQPSTFDTTFTFENLLAGTFPIEVRDSLVPIACSVPAQGTVPFFENPIANYIATNAKFCGTGS